MSGNHQRKSRSASAPANAAGWGEFEKLAASRFVSECPGFVSECPGEDLNLHDLAVASS